MNIFWSKALLSTQHSVKLVSYKKGLVLVMVPANFVVEKKFPNMFFVLRCCCCCYCSGENSTKFLTKNVCIYLDDVVAPTHTINAKEVKQKSWLKTLLLQCDA